MNPETERLVKEEMQRVVRCNQCGKPEYWGSIRWLSGRNMCRRCYKADYEDRTGKVYEWDDLDGPFPEE